MTSPSTGVVRSEFATDPEYREILELFAEALPERRRCLTGAFRTGNISALRVLAHQLKGAGGGFGFPTLTRLAAELEVACDDGALERIATALERVLAFLQRIAI